MIFILFLGAFALTAFALYKKAAKESRKTFICRHCGARFTVGQKELAMTSNSWGEYKLRCPECGVRDYCGSEGK